MKRRDFIKVIGAAAMWPVAANAQTQALPVVGLLRSAPAAPFTHLIAALRQGLADEGFVEGRNVVIDQRHADNQLERLPALAADLVRRPASVIVVNLQAAEAAKAATTTIPIVFVSGDDPVRLGLVASLNRPGGNVTGVTFFGGGQLSVKRLELLHDLVPRATVIGLLQDPNYPGSAAELPGVVAAAKPIGLKIVPITASSEHDFEPAFVKMRQAGAGALLVGGSPVFASHIRELVALAARHAVPAIYEQRAYVAAGGLISYAASFSGAYRQAGVYAGRILKGAKPSELPVLQPSEFELAINMKTAKALGLEVPSSIILRANELIE